MGFWSWLLDPQHAPWATVAVSFFSAIGTIIIAFMQWRISQGMHLIAEEQKNIAVSKLGLDIFNKRYDAWERLYNNMIEYDKEIVDYFDNKEKIFNDISPKLNKENYTQEIKRILSNGYEKFRSDDVIYKSIDEMIILFDSTEMVNLLNELKIECRELSRKICGDAELLYKYVNEGGILFGKNGLSNFTLTFEKIFKYNERIGNTFSNIRDLCMKKMTLPI
ncbi:hypothetical protein E3E11_02725 [Oecophyllibacter saccharovorans]|uniref:hypothetical protein n=1 Tax=Oecophyllibacter saccharovorans TaxID=2558360 RepID=UPI00114400FE|nr:hypothetical protein [Oecophyllibacter saccharovorans]QDH14954.1 hypothetical protein E3E11_02725 [Oecophyllibacter saccharovorans]